MASSCFSSRITNSRTSFKGSLMIHFPNDFAFFPDSISTNWNSAIPPAWNSIRPIVWSLSLRWRGSFLENTFGDSFEVEKFNPLICMASDGKLAKQMKSIVFGVCLRLTVFSLWTDLATALSFPVRLHNWTISSVVRLFGLFLFARKSCESKRSYQ